MPDKNDVPLMYRAQLEGRCQLHRIYKQQILRDIAQEEGLQNAEQYSVRWVNQWLESQSDIENYSHPLIDNNLEETTQFQAKKYTISWRFVTNAGKDDGIIRPLITASGLPFYPGSSMKGAFRQACRREEETGRIPLGTCDRYCGAKLKNDDSQPGILRFHGGYPINKNWQKNLVDIVHPQSGWQVKTKDTTKKPDGESAFALISLYQPKLQFGISTTKPEETNWEEIWTIWEKALGYGIGCRVSCGYGFANETLKDKVTGDVLYQVKLHGNGGLSKLLNKQSEFRPNIFRAAIRGHALRIFAGLNQAHAEDIVDQLFGGIRSGKERVGLLGMTFHNLQSYFENGSDVYDVSGNLIWLLLGKLDKKEHRPCLVKLVKKLTQFAMLLGGFGKSWRRADHRIFYPEYTKHIIGCHWDWINDDSSPVNNIDDATALIQETIDAAKDWMLLHDFEINSPLVKKPSNKTSQPKVNNSETPQLKTPVARPIEQENKTKNETDWREAWYVENVQVWGRIAKDTKDSKVIHWLHSSRQGKNQQPQKSHNRNQPKKAQKQSNSLALQRAAKPTNSNNNSRPSIYRTALTGRLKDDKKSPEPTQIGRLWHRMYPVKNGQYLELITIFPKGCTEAESLIEWLYSQAEWKKVW